jgi:hypothetical protein
MAQTRGKEKKVVNWTQLLKGEMETAYTSTAKLLDKVDPDGLDWKPGIGCNWMTVGQLLQHISEACGGACKGFVTGDWGLPPGMKFEDLPPEEMLPPAEKLPAIGTLDEAKAALSQDRALALRMVEQAGEADLFDKEMAAPWAPGVECPLGLHLLRMVQHLERHKSQLFYYLKLQGKPVNTVDLWG